MRDSVTAAGTLVFTAIWRCLEQEQQLQQKWCADLGVANVKVAVRFRWEPGHHLPASCLEVGLQLSGGVGDAHLTPSSLRAECHYLVHLPHILLHQHQQDRS